MTRRSPNNPVLYDGAVRYAGWWSHGSYPFVETTARTRARYIRSNHGRGRLWHAIREGEVHWPRDLEPVAVSGRWATWHSQPHVSFRTQCGPTFFLDRATLAEDLPNDVLLRECCVVCFGFGRGPARRSGVHCL